MTAATAFDSDVLIYAADKDHSLGGLVRTHLTDPETDAVGSMILLPEVLSKPTREDPDSPIVTRLEGLLSRIDLRPLDGPTAELALQLAADYGLRAADAVHLATAVMADADYFLTNNRKDFPKSIAEIAIIYPEDLA